MSSPDRRAALRLYLIFRIKLIEFLDLHKLNALLESEGFAEDGKSPRTSQHLRISLRTGIISYVALLLEENKQSLNLHSILKTLFPSAAQDIDETWQRLVPGLKDLKAFRDKVGFHADHPQAYFRARRAVMDHPEATKATEDFVRLCERILRLEAFALPDLERKLDGLFDELDQADAERETDRQAFRNYLMMNSQVGN